MGEANNVVDALATNARLGLPRRLCSFTGIKRDYPDLQVAVYDGMKSINNEIIELPRMELSREPSPDRCPGQISWHYDRAEIIADGVVHAIGVCLGLIGAVTIVVIAIKMERIDVAPVMVYVIGLVTMLAFSAAYNMWPVSRAKWVLRRFDHSAIYLLIAGTYTPFLMQMKNVLASAGLGIGVWLSAGIGMALKLALPGRFDRLAVVLCLLLGWSGVMAYDSLASVLPSSSLWLLAIGGILYSLGTVFHLLKRLRFHNAIWHGFVLLAASCHYSAVLACLPLS
jgi:hemolysin III